MTDSQETNITAIEYSDLISDAKLDTDTLLQKIGQGFGNSNDALGIIIVTNIPDYKDLRTKLLQLSHKLATCTPQHVLDELTIESACYSVGWSHGKERVEGDNKFDTAKGSFYANPLTDDLLEFVLERDFSSSTSGSYEEETDLKNHNRKREELVRIAKENPAFFAKNVWPKSQPDLESAFKEMGQLIHHVGESVARLCDLYVLANYPQYTPGKIEEIVTKSMCCKGRLLHYFPMDNDESLNDKNLNNENTSFSNWCGWHNDHGSLTGLVPAMYLDSSGNEIACPDSSAGLYIKSRRGDVVHVKIPSNCLAFQIGETAQIHTGGLLQATPHAVRGCKQGDIKCKGVSREAFAVFMEPE